MKLGGDRNQCTVCDEYFNSTKAFEKHRTGDFGVNRRCLTPDEMREKGMDVSSSGYWVTMLMPKAAYDICTDAKEPTSEVEPDTDTNREENG